MRQPASRSAARPRSRRKAATPAPQVRNVGSVEALLSLTLGVLMVVSALVPRTFKQAFLLAFGGGLLYRGLTGDCGFYRALGVGTAAPSGKSAKG